MESDRIMTEEDRAKRDDNMITNVAILQSDVATLIDWAGESEEAAAKLLRLVQVTTRVANVALVVSAVTFACMLLVVMFG